MPIDEDMEARFKLLEPHEIYDHPRPLSPEQRAAYDVMMAARTATEQLAQTLSSVTHRLPAYPPYSEPAAVRYRIRDELVPLCQRHAQELLDVRFIAKHDLRPVWDDRELLEKSVCSDIPLDDLRMFGRFPYEDCTMCNVHPAYGNRCLQCAQLLPSQWPSVYCSNRCALEDL